MERVSIFMAWPYANGPLHLGHVAGNCLPADIQYKYERSKGRKVLMCSGSDEHGTPITVTAEQENITPQEVVDRFHEINLKALIDLGCSWDKNVDPRGIEFGGTLYNRTTDTRHKEIVKEVFSLFHKQGYLQESTMKQYCSINNDGSVKFLPDRYVEGLCPRCKADGARGDQCDECGATFENNELINPRSKLDSNAEIQIKDTKHLFFRLELFQKQLENFALENNKLWKPNVRSMTKNWLEMGLRPRAVTRDIEWGIELPNMDNKWNNKRIYVWFEAVQGYYSCPRVWAERYATPNNHSMGKDAWKLWLNHDVDSESKSIYFMGKDNIPFHTIIWPAIQMGINSATHNKEISNVQSNGDLMLATNVPANEYLMLQGGQFSKSRKHAVWLPEFLEHYQADTLRYYLSINMPEGHDTDFRWDEYVDRVNNELIGNYGNYVNRVLTLAHRLNSDNKSNPLSEFDNSINFHNLTIEINELLNNASKSLEKHRFKEALRHIMNISQKGNVLLQKSEPWKHIKNSDNKDRASSLSGLAYAWKIMRGLAIVTRPFMPFQSEHLWEMMGEKEDIDNVLWDDAFNFNNAMAWTENKPKPLFKKLDLDEIIKREESIANNFDSNDEEIRTSPINKESDYINFEDFMKVEMRTGKIIKVEEHPNADKLWVVTLQDTPTSTRTICAGLKGIYNQQKLEGMDVVYVANLEPRKLRGIMSEGMLLAADDEQGNVKLLTPEGDISTGSLVR
ncbi:MAG: methionine--tRNA ligase [Euryarchaeota archaeon]|nr:methionine--tRNA ligase [Euryarchaeota archaeon]